MEPSNRGPCLAKKYHSTFCYARSGDPLLSPPSLPRPLPPLLLFSPSTSDLTQIDNILALRGGPLLNHTPDPTELTSALDLVRHIRARHGNHFGIAVAGYPEAHPSKIPDGADFASPDAYKSDLQYLKEKVEAGTDLIITQLFFDAEVFVKFVKDCPRVGIGCPVRVPPEVRAAREDEAALAAYGVGLETEICRRILGSGIGTSGRREGGGRF